MANYQVLAQIYDELVASVDYEEWACYMQEIFREYGVKPETIADLACGTGNTTIPLALKGYRVTGVDLAPAMLDRARDKAVKSGVGVEFYQQDMRELRLAEPQDIILSYHDGINYLVEPGDLGKLCRRVEENLRPGGLFIFDLVNVDRLASANGESTVLDEDGRTLIWETYYRQDKDIWEIHLTGFIRQPSGLYEKFSEVHREKFYPREEVERAVAGAGLELLACYKPFTLEKVDGGGWAGAVDEKSSPAIKEMAPRRLFYVAGKARAAHRHYYIR